MSSLGTEAAFEVLGRARALQDGGRDVVNLAMGAPDLRTPENIVAAGRRAIADGHHFYTAPKGLLALREAVAAEIHASRGVEVDPDNVLIVPGGKPTLSFAIEMFGEPGAEILYPNPGFPIYESLIRFTGATPVPIPLREAADFAFNAEEALSRVSERSRLLILNSPANPTGGVTARAELERLAAGLERFPEVALLSDEIYSRLVFDGLEHVSPLQVEGLSARTILLDGWSKTYSMTGWRLGFGLWPAALIDHAERLQINWNSCASAPVQMAGLEALTGPQDSVDALRAGLDLRRAAMVAGLRRVPGFSCVMPRGSFFAFPNVTGTGMGSKEVEEYLLREAGVAVVSGASFGALGEGFLRFSYAVGLEDIERALARVRACAETLPST